MLSTPKTAPVGSPFGLFSSGSAWNARYRYDEPSTSNNVFSGSVPDTMTHEKLPPKTAALGHEISPREAWKLFGIMAEFFEATERLAGIRPAVSVFGSARVQPGTAYYRLAEQTARLLSAAGFAVFSGGGPVLREATNKGAFEGSGLAVGLNIDLPREQFSNRYQDISLRFKHFFARKVMFAKFTTAWIVLPGGFGTLDELFEALTLVQTGKTPQMPIILVNEPFW